MHCCGLSCSPSLDHCTSASGKFAPIFTIYFIVKCSEFPIQRLLRCMGQFALQGLDFITHVHSSLSTHASFLTDQTRSKYGPTLKASYVFLPVITSRPLRLPYALNTHLAAFTQLDGCLPWAEPHGDAGISGPTSVIFHRMPLALPRVPRRYSYPFLPCRLRPSPSAEGRDALQFLRFSFYVPISKLYINQLAALLLQNPISEALIR